MGKLSKIWEPTQTERIYIREPSEAYLIEVRKQRDLYCKGNAKENCDLLNLQLINLRKLNRYMMNSVNY